MSTTWWWISFADPDRPEGQQFLGVALVEIPIVPRTLGGKRLAALALVTESRRRGCNPGGEMSFIELPDRPPAKFRNRLLTKAEADGPELTTWGNRVARAAGRFEPSPAARRRRRRGRSKPPGGRPA